jgi:hypothetical protein
MYYEPEGPGYQVVDSVNRPGMDRVGLVTMAKRGRGWVELTPDEARELAAALIRAADDTETAAERELDRSAAKLRAHERCARCGGDLPMWECDLLARNPV